MPTVPRRDPASITKQAPLPGVQVTGGATAETFGGGASAEKLSAAVTGLGESGMKLAFSAQDQADKTLATEQDIALIKKKNAILNDVATKYRGADSIKASDYANKEWQNFTNEMNDSLPNDRVRMMVGKKQIAYYGQIDTQVQDHTARHLEDYRINTDKAAAITYIEDAGNDPYNPETALLSQLRLKSLRENDAKVTGTPLDSPQYKVQEEKDTKDIRAAVIEKSLAMGDSDYAKRYFEYYKEDFKDPKEAEEMSKYLQARSEQIQNDAKQLVKTEQDSFFHEKLVQVTKFDYTLSDAKKDLTTINPKTGAPFLSDSDYLQFQHMFVNEDYQTAAKQGEYGVVDTSAKIPVSNLEAFNKLDAAIRTGMYDGAPISPKQIDYEIMNQSRGNKATLHELDRDVLINRNKGKAPTQDDIDTDTYTNNIRSQMENMIQRGVFGFGAEKRKAEIEATVRTFTDKVNKEHLSGPKIKEAADAVSWAAFIKAHPDMAGQTPGEVQHVIYGAKTGVEKVMNPSYESKVKGTLTWNRAVEKPKKAETPKK